MKPKKTERQALLALLHRIYETIRDIENEWGIRLEGGDFRPRIDYFHDAVRVFTASAEDSPGGGRLSVEMLAYDIGMLRFIQADPLARRAMLANLSTKTGMTDSLADSSADKTGLKPNASVKRTLMEQYKNYAVVFSALLADTAERNYLSRLTDCETQQHDIEEAMGDISAGTRNPNALVDIQAIANQAATREIAEIFRGGLKGGTLKKRMAARDALQKLKEARQAIDTKARAIEKAHMAYATGQLAIYENSRDVVKGMAMRGLNIVGDFVENAVRDARRGGKGM